MLVLDHAQMPVLRADAQHRLDEIAAVRGDDPGGPHDRMARARGAHRQLAAQFGGTIDAERGDRVVRLPFALLVAGEDVIGRDLDERDARGRARLAERGRRHRVDRPGGHLVALRLVDRGIGGAVDDRRPWRALMPLLYLGGDRPGIGKIELGLVDRDNPPALGPGGAGELGAELAARAGDEDALHCSVDTSTS